MQSIPIADLGGTLSLLGLGAVVAAVVTHFLNVLRDRASARRAWLGEALSNFYGPVSAKLEARFRWQELIREEHAKIGVIHANSQEAKVERAMINANIAAHEEVRAVIEENLYFADEVGIRDSAIDFMVDSYIDEWRRDAAEIEELLAAGKGIVVWTDEPRSEFLDMMNSGFEKKAEEFQALSRASSFWDWVRRILPQ